MRTRRLLLVVLCVCSLLFGQWNTVSASDLQRPAALIPSEISFQLVTGGLSAPVFATYPPDGSARTFIVQQGGQIVIFKNGSLNGAPFLDVSSLIMSMNSPGGGSEQGLLGLAFAPDYSTSGKLYVTYTIEDNSVVLARYLVSGSNADLADSASAHILLTIPKANQNHNGGMIAFGADGYLYMSVGDGGGGGDQECNAQNKTKLLGKLLRLDVSTTDYTSPGTNPFFNTGGGVKQEIWAYGLRNSWRFSFDKTTHDLYIGDVGQDSQEEIDFQLAGSTGGQNYGWNIKEGNLNFPASAHPGCTDPPLSAYVPPVNVYNHGSGDSIGCSVTGGYVYRGTRYPLLVGYYFFGDFCSGRLWALAHNAQNQWGQITIPQTPYQISSFAEDPQGELYILDYGGAQSGVGQLIHIAGFQQYVTAFFSQPANDGFIFESSETSNQGGVVFAGGSLMAVGDDSLNRQLKGIFSIDTSAIPDNGVVLVALLAFREHSLVGMDPFAAMGPLQIDVRSGPFSNDPTLTAGDFSASPSQANAFALSANIPADWFVGQLPNASMVNLTGLTQFRLHFTQDDNNNGMNDFIRIYAGAGPASMAPRLVVLYVAP